MASNLKNNQHKKSKNDLVQLMSSKVSIGLVTFKNQLAIPERFFLVFSIIFGCIFVFLTPPMQAPDEQAHFFKAYQVSNIDFFSNKLSIDGEDRFGEVLPKSIHLAAKEFIGDVSGNPSQEFDPSLIGRFIDQPLKPLEIAPVAFEGSAIYSPVAYIPQALGIALGKLFDASPLMLIWVGRLFNLMAWVGIIYVAIRILPFAKWAFVILALNPVAVFLSASLSADVIIIALAFLFFSLVASTLKQNNPISRNQKLFILIVLILLSLTKPVSILLALLLVIIPARHFSSKMRYVTFCIIGLIASFLVAFAWNFAVKDGISVVGDIQRPGVGVNPSEQLIEIIENPLLYMKNIIINYILVSPGYSGDAVLSTLFGAFGWLDTSIPLWTIILYIMILMIAVLYQFGRGVAFTGWQKLLVVTIFCLACVGNITALYLNYTPVGSVSIDGVQGRYFIPYAVLLLAVFTGRKIVLNLSQRSLLIVMLTGITIVLLMTTLKIYLRYYS